MISAIVLVPDLDRSGDPVRAREVAVRSLAWLVAAVVAGVVRDVTLAGPAGIGLGGIADEAGCKVVETNDEVERLRWAVVGSREARLLVLRAGYQPEAALTDEIATFLRRTDADAVAVVLAAPETILDRILPGGASVVAVLVPRGKIGTGAFGRLARRAGKATRFRARATRIT